MKIRIAILILLTAFLAAGCDVPSLPNFEEKFAYSIIISPMAYGSVAPSRAKAAEGTRVTLTISPNSGYILKNMRVTPLEKNDETVSISGEGNSRIFTMRSSSVIVAAEFEPVTYSISIESMLNGEITANRETAAIGEVVALSIKADPGYVLDNTSLTVTRDNSSTVAVNSSSFCACGFACICEECDCERFDYYFLMPASNVTINAEFVKLFNITIQAAGGEYGDIFVSHESAVEGAPIVIVFTPNEGYRVKAENFSITGTNSGLPVTSNLTTEQYYIQTRTFLMPAFDITVIIEFEEIPPGTISLYFEGFFDEEMNLSQYGTTIRRNWVDSEGRGDSISVTIAEGFDRYYWYLDDYLRSETGNSITVDGYRLQLGVYTITAVVVKDGIPYSKIVTFTVVDY
ncbi:MAG: hypothetical protein FWB73_02985 [Treponema sp.]|nr:hypothetical protein [Treponema sp.]